MNSGGYCDKSAHDNHEDLVEEVARLKAELTQTRLDLLNSDAIRGALVKAAAEQAGDMFRSLELLEAAFHEGADFVARGDDAGKTLDQAFREWTQRNLSHKRKPTNQEPS